MKAKLLWIALICITTSISAQDTWTDRSRILPDELRKIEVGMLLLHTPTVVYPELNADTGLKAKFVWKHNTMISSLGDDIKVIKAGSYIWTAGKGWMPNMQLNPQEFAALFSCANGILKKGSTYTFERNYRFGDQLYGGDALWFVIGKDSRGRIWKGIGIVETEDTLK